MTVKELFQTLEIEDIIEVLKDKYPDSALRPLSEYKENYDIILNTEFSGEGGTITYQEDGDSDVYMIEGDYYDNIVGMEVILPDTNSVPKEEAAAEIIWSAAPFGRVTSSQWENFFEDLVNPPKANEYALKAKRIDILMDLLYCRNKITRRELKREMNSTSEDFCISGEAWLALQKDKKNKRNLNRRKRKREYILQKRYEEMVRLREIHDCLDRVKIVINPLPIAVEKEILLSKYIEKITYQTQTLGKYNRLYYLEDLLTNPLYQDSKEPFSKTNSIFICILYSSSNHSCSMDERVNIEKILRSRFKDKKWYLFQREDDIQEKDLELEILTLQQ